MSRTSIELVAQVTHPASVALPPATPNNASTYSIATRQSDSNDDDRRTLTEVVSAGQKDVSKGTTAVVITSVTCITGISSLLAGLVTVGLPTIAKDLDLAPSLELWCVLSWRFRVKAESDIISGQARRHLRPNMRLYAPLIRRRRRCGRLPYYVPYRLCSTVGLYAGVRSLQDWHPADRLPRVGGHRYLILPSVGRQHHHQYST